MAKETGLSQLLFAHGYNLSGDTSEWNAGPTMDPLETPVLDKAAMVRLAGLTDGELSFTTWFDDGTELAHDALAGNMPTTDAIILIVFGSAVGDKAFGIVGKRTGYSQSRDAAGKLSLTVTAMGDGNAIEDFEMLTSGVDTHASASSSASRDDGTQAAAVSITSSSQASPSNILCAAVHGLTTGDTVVIAGHTGATPDINSEHTVTVIDTTNYTIPVNVTVAGTGGTSTLTSTRNGLVAIVQIVDIDSGTPTILIEDSPDDSTWATLISFTAVLSGNEPTAERKAVTGIVNRHQRVTTTGTFTNLDHVVATRRGLAEDDVDRS